MAAALTPITQFDFSGGENLVTSPYLVGQRQSLRVQNLLLDEHGALRQVDGTLIQTTAPAGEEGNVVILAVSWAAVDGTLRKFVTVRSGATNKLYNRGATPWTLVGTFTGNQTTPEAAIFGDLFIQTDGYNTPKKVSNAGVFGTLGGGLPGAQHLKLHQGYLWALDTAAATTATDGPSSLRASDTNAPETWPLANQSFLAKDDGTKGMGFGTFTIAEVGISPTAALVAFKEGSSFQITGVYGAGGNLSIQKIQSDMGCVAPRSIQFVSGFGIIRLSHRGFTLFNGMDDRLISEEIRPRIFGRDDITGIDWTNVALCWASQSANPPLYLCAVPLVGSVMTRVFVYDLVRRAWSTIDLPFTIASINLILESGKLPVVLLTDAPPTGVLGRVRRWFAGDATFDGTAVSWTFRSRPAFLTSPMRPAFFRRMIVDVLVTQSATVAYQFLFPNQQNGVLNTVPLGTQPLSAGGVWPSTAWATRSLSTAGGTIIDDQVALDMLVRAPNAMVELSGSGLVRIRGLEWHAKPKALRTARF